MCGRYSYSLSPEELRLKYGADVPEELLEEPRFNVSPSQVMPIVTTKEEGDKAIISARWGLVPWWAKDPTIGNRMINARAETLLEKGAFKTLLRRRRCLVPTDGFYEWKRYGWENANKQSAKGKTPYRIYLRDESAFSFAGLWDTWKDAEGRVLTTYTIITTSPNTLMSEIHDRMPVILAPSDESHWLGDENEGEDFFMSLLKPYGGDDLVMYPVSTLVNTPAHEGAQLWEPAKFQKPVPPQLGLFG